MRIGRAERVRMERAHVRAWPALRTADIDGWLWRGSGGGSQRANSVSTVDFTGSDPERAVAEVEALYAALGAPARFQTFDDTAPTGLPQVLRARGYRETEATVTMFKRPGRPEAPACVTVRDTAWDDWLGVYLGEITANRRQANAEILARVPRPRAFFGAARGGSLAATALCVAGHGCAVIECVATATAARRQGAARDALLALEHWAAGQDADLLGLQVVATNAPAIALYRSLGFVPGAENRFWVK